MTKYDKLQSLLIQAREKRDSFEEALRHIEGLLGVDIDSDDNEWIERDAQGRNNLVEFARQFSPDLPFDRLPGDDRRQYEIRVWRKTLIECRGAAKVEAGSPEEAVAEAQRLAAEGQLEVEDIRDGDTLDSEGWELEGEDGGVVEA